MFMLQPLSKAVYGLVLLLLSAFYPLEANAQCCSTGSPVGASLYVGVLNKHALRINAFYRQSRSEVYYEGSRPSDDSQDMANHARYSYAGISAEYGITHKLTAQLDMGYFMNKLIDFRNPVLTDHNGRGLSNGTAMLKYGIYVHPARMLEITAGAGLKFPFSREPMKAPNGTLLQLDARPSTNAFGITGMLLFSKEFSETGWRAFLLNKFEHNYSNINDYRSGELLLTSLFVSKRLMPRFFAIAQWRNEFHGKDTQDGEREVNTGYHLMVLVPQLSYSIFGKWNVSLLYDIPVYKNYQGKQLTPQYSFAASMSRVF